MLWVWDLLQEEEKGSARLPASAGETLRVLQRVVESNLTVLPGHPASPLLCPEHSARGAWP